MRVLIPILVAALVLVTVVAIRRGGGLIRGVADNMLVSPARPAIAVRVSPGLRMVDARRADLSVQVQGSTMPGAGASVWYALYERPEPTEFGAANAGTAESDDTVDVIPLTTQPFTEMSQVRLVAVLAETDSPYTWTDKSEPGQKLLRQSQLMLDAYSGTASTFVLSILDDPWADTSEMPDARQYEEDEDPWRNGSLVRRFTFLLFQRRAKVVVEYREPLPAAGNLPLADNLPLLAAFEQRAGSAFQLISGDKVGIPRPEQQPPYPPAGVGRKALANFIGDVWREGGH